MIFFQIPKKYFLGFLIFFVLLNVNSKSPTLVVVIIILCRLQNSFTRKKIEMIYSMIQTFKKILVEKEEKKKKKSPIYKWLWITNIWKRCAFKWLGNGENEAKKKNNFSIFTRTTHLYLHIQTHTRGKYMWDGRKLWKNHEATKKAFSYFPSFSFTFTIIAQNEGKLPHISFLFLNNLCFPHLDISHILSFSPQAKLIRFLFFLLTWRSLSSCCSLYSPIVLEEICVYIFFCES